jgi:hypothetical protein
MLPDDEELNEQVLQQMRDGGDNLSAVRPVCFQFVFPERKQAQGFSEVMVRRGLVVDVAVDPDGPVSELPWDVNVTIEMKPELTDITGYERNLGQVAIAHEGRADGWYCERIVGNEA